MTGFVILVTLLLVGLIILLMFRVNSLLKVMRNVNEGQKVDRTNQINAILIPISFVLGSILMVWSYFNARPYFLPEAASEHGVGTDLAFWIIMGVLVLAFFLTNILLFLFPYLYQYKANRKAYWYPENHTLELVWTLVPAVAMALVVVFGLKQWNSITEEVDESKCEVIEVMAKQFAWQVRYPGKDGKLGRYQFKYIDPTNEFGLDLTDPKSLDDFMPGELHLPKGKKVLLRIRARDVIHSVFLPHFRVKMDAVPGMPTRFAFTPTISTEEMRKITGKADFNYELACTEICGRGHYAMKFKVIVDELPAYEKWKSEQKPWVEQNVDYASKFVPSLKKPEVVVVDTVKVQNDSLSANTAEIKKDSIK